MENSNKENKKKEKLDKDKLVDENGKVIEFNDSISIENEVITIKDISN